MIAKDVINFYNQFEKLGIKIWIDGGWAVDALLGEQTRPHNDLDIAIQWKDVPKLRELLTQQGYQQIKEDSQWNFVLADGKDHEIDVHGFIFDDKGNIVEGIMYPAQSLTGSGTINGQSVRCISAQYMVKFLAPWIHKWPNKYLNAVSSLCKKFGIALPEEFIKFKNSASTDNHHEDKSILGFWIYLLTDLVMFAALFATYAALHQNTFGGPSGKELFSLPFDLTETLILLTSSFTCGLAMVYAHRGHKNKVLAWFSITCLLGLSFLTMEISEFRHLIAEGNSWQRSGFLSSFFALVGTHGLHIAIGSLWIIVALKQVWSLGLTPFILSKLTRLSLFWHFLDLVWIFIFTIVYLMAKI